MGDYEFEHLVADLWQTMGWETEVTDRSSDRGIDVVATKSYPYERKALLQAKRYGPDTSVGSPEVQQYDALRRQESKVDEVLVVTSGEFTRQARELAEELNVKLVDGERLAELLLEPGNEHLVDEYDVLGAGDQGAAGEGAARTDADATRSRESVRGRLADALEPRWKWVAYATGAWLVAFAGVGAFPDGSALWTVFAYLVPVAWLGLPVSLWFDGKRWTNRWHWYAAAALVPLLSIAVGGVYLVRKGQREGLEPA